MTIKKFLEKAKKFEIEAYKKYPDLFFNYVPFAGSPQKHPYDQDKIIVVIDPFSTHTSYYEFNIADIEGVQELPSLVTIEGKSVTMVRVWVRKGSIAVKGIPFVVEDTRKRVKKGRGGQVFILDRLRRRVRSFYLTNCACALSENGGLSK